MTYTVGQVVHVHIFQNRDKANITPYEIIKVGRKWATLSGSHYRFDVATGMIDGSEYSDLGQVYASAADFYNERLIRAAWEAFQDLIKRTYRPPAHLTLEAIQEASKALGIENVNTPKFPQ